MSLTDTGIEGGGKLHRKNLRRGEASVYLLERWGVSYKPQTLAKLATVGGGPAYRKLSRFPLYPVEELDRWAESRLGPLQSSSST